MYIHWFPGHMTKAFRLMEKSMTLVDSAIYVLDARAPLSCLNYEFNRLVNNKPILYVLNKSDMITVESALKWEKYFSSDGALCVSANSLTSKGAVTIKKALIKLHAPLTARYVNKGVLRTPRSIVIGVPNTGKSTLINNLASRKKAETANKPGVTRTVQWIKIDANIELMDSPGVLYPDFKDQRKAFNLAAIGSVKDERYDVLELSELLYQEVIKRNPLGISTRYPGLDNITELTPIKAIAKLRGYFIQGGEFDVERAATAFVWDFRKGLLGKICLDD